MRFVVSAVLMEQRFEDILGAADRELGRVGVVGVLVTGAEDRGVALTVEVGEAEAGPLGRGRLEVEELAALLLVVLQFVAHHVQGLV